ncbi:MAG: molybdopterin-synthase adenylyltransferase MoeB [Gemmatimonadales bacterium]|nr:molybdopterin-synthase adenylyltransferase MoeB [Gemmatimonadales bacterium]
MTLSPPELRRYARHLILPEIGPEGQTRLAAARVLLVGAGGLGSPAALYLAAAGVGTLTIADGDAVDDTNLQRQVLHGTAAVGRPKVASAAERLRDLNPHVRVVPLAERLTAATARALVAAHDVVLDGSDNFPTRYLLNDACVLERRPLVYGSILRFEGQLALFATPGGPCYRCLFADPPPPELVPSCADAGVVGALPGVIGAMQALEAIKLLCGIGTSLAGRLLLFDGLAARWREIAVRRDPGCPACGDTPTISALIDYERFCGVSPAAPVAAPDDAEIEPAELAGRLARGEQPQLVDVREPWEFAIAHLPGATLIPLGELAARSGEVDPRRPVVTICHHGVRSLTARAILRRHGVVAVRSLAGGVEAWAREVDPAMARY